MILTLREARVVDPNITQAALDGIEVAIRNVTHNSFRDYAFETKGLTFFTNPETQKTFIGFSKPVDFFSRGDTIQVTDTAKNDGLYVVTEVVDMYAVGVDKKVRAAGEFPNAFAVLVDYPPDVKDGVRKLIAYDRDHAGKAGIKSETIARMSVTYQGETDGYPKELLAFMRRYERLPW
jgi:hypothetical protein